MKLPHLDQLVPLERGEAGLLARAVSVLVRDVTHAERPVPLVDAITLTPLAALGKNLARLHELEQRPPRTRPGRCPRLLQSRPRLLRVPYDQLAVLMLHRLALPHCDLSTQEKLQLQVVLGKFQQKSLNLQHWIKVR